MSERVNFSTSSAFEPLRGYSRAVQVGDLLYISGTTASNDKGEVEFPGDAYEQTRYVINRVKGILHKAGFAIEHVVRTRLFVTQINHWDAYARAHREAFENIRPASSILQVEKLVDLRMVIEMEVDAVRGYSTVRRQSLELD